MITICKRCGIEFEALDDRKKLCQDCVEVKKIENAYKQWDKKWKEAKKKENHYKPKRFDNVCKELAEKKMSYAEYQKQKTLAMIRGESHEK